MTAVFPSLPGLGYSVTKAAKFKTQIQKAVTGRELRVADQSLPIWEFTLTYELLRDDNDVSGGAGPGTGYNELRTLMGFFLEQQGSFGAFLFDDTSDDSVTGQALGTGDGTTTTFSFVRSMGGFVEPVGEPNTVSTIYFNDVPVSASTYTVDPGGNAVVFNTAPGAGVAITSDFTYYFMVRFSDDTAEFENFMYQLWSAKQIKLQSVLL